MTQAEAAQILGRAAEMLFGELPEENCRRAIERIEELMLGLHHEFAAATRVLPAAAGPAIAALPRPQTKRH